MAGRCPGLSCPGPIPSGRTVTSFPGRSSRSAPVSLPPHGRRHCPWWVRFSSFFSRNGREYSLLAHEPRVHHPGVRSRLHIYHIKPIGPNCKTSGERTTSLGWYGRVYLSHSIAYQGRPGPLSRHITQCIQTKYHYLNSASCKIRKHPRRSTGLSKYSKVYYVRADFMMLPLTSRLFSNILPIVFQW